VAAVGLNLHFGHTGLLNFGQVGFFLVGAYGVGVTVDSGGPLWLGGLVGIVLAVALALLLGLPTLRLRADYLAIVTIAVAECLRLAVRSTTAQPLTGGVFGLKRVATDFYDVNPIPRDRYGIGGLNFTERELWVMVIGWTLAVLGVLLIRTLMRAPWGRVIRAIREDEDAARSLGKNAFWYKLQSLVVGGVFGAFAGMVLLFNQQSVVPDTYLPVLTFFVWTVVILGGAGSTWGPILGAIMFWFIVQFSESLTREAVTSGTITFLDAQEVASLRFVVVGLMLMLLMIFRPQGILGKREEMLLDRH
jgi:branched-chain amino acid transport system permease protein